jgi:protein-S-isoprenylcysteine O-methyltransferase Ste14
MNALNAKAFAGLLFLNLVTAALLFVPAGTFDYWQAWAFLVVYFVPSLAITLDLMRHDRALLTRRMRGGPLAEKEPAQRLIMSIASLGFIGLIALPALDHRFAWSHMPTSIPLVGDAFVLIAWLAIFLVFKENTFSATTVELAADHKVISTGPYALIRHPMYAAGLLMLGAMPIALGSWWGLLILAAILPALLWRLLDEERFLIKNLPGYVAYQGKVRYRLIPLVW